MAPIPAIKGRLGNTDYYILAMKAGDLANRAVIPSEMDGWEEKTVEEIYQRNIKYTRVEEQIAPYLAETKTRFFGSIIIAAEHFSDDKFESLESLAEDGTIPKAYRNSTQGVGLIHFDGGEVLVPLDGQHRVKAIRCAISGRGENGRKLSFESDTSLADETVSVILVPYNIDRAREIFTIVNKYAKTTSINEDIIINDADIIALISRQVANEIIGARIVEIYKTSLAAKSHCFTTITAIYNCTEDFLSQKFDRKFTVRDKTKLPDKTTIRLYTNAAMNFWRKITSEIEKWEAALQDRKSAAGDNYRIQLRKTNLLGKPIIHLALVGAYLRLVKSGISENKAFEALNKISWGIPDDPVDKPEWHSVCMDPSYKMTNRKVPLAIRVFAYMAGENLNKRSKEKLLSDYKENHWDPDKSKVELPPQVKL